MSEDWDRLDTIEKELRGHRQNVKDLKESKGVYTELINDAEEGIELWENLKDKLDDGETVYDPSKKRKRSAEPKKSCKKAKKSRSRSVYSMVPLFILYHPINPITNLVQL